MAAGASDITLRARLMPLLARVGDLERLINRVVQRIAMPRDLVALAQGLAAVDELAASSQSLPDGLATICPVAPAAAGATRADRAGAGG